MTTPEDHEPTGATGVADPPAGGPAPEERGLRDVHLRADFIEQIRDVIDAADRERLKDLVQPLHSADIADLFEVLSASERRALARLVGDALEPEVLSDLSPAALEDVLEAMPPKAVAEAVQQLETDDAIYVLEDMDEAAQHEVLRRLAKEERAAVEEGLAYPEDSAGRLMQRDLIAVPEFWTIGQTIDYLRAQEEDEVPADFYELIVVDPAYRPIGSVPLSRVLRCRRHIRIRDVMNPRPHIVHVATDQEEVAREFAKYHLISAAVVDDSGRLVGVITVDDVVDVIEEEAEEDILALAGVSEGDVNIGIFEVSRARFIWLIVNLGTAILASLVIGLFDATIKQMVALAVLMPIVASMGGNAGTQTMTVAVRALATKELSAANAARIIAKELTVSVINGALLAIVVALTALAWFHDIGLAAVIAVAMVINIIAAGLSGILIPMALDRLGIDPAIASSVFVTTVTDVIGFFAFLGLAAAFLL
ncbi:MAG: magnesium transporter [Rhodothalassiaceae bacterium]